MRRSNISLVALVLTAGVAVVSVDAAVIAAASSFSQCPMLTFILILVFLKAIDMTSRACTILRQPSLQQPDFYIAV